MKNLLLALICIFLCSCYGQKRQTDRPYITEIWEGGKMKTGWGWKGGGYEYIQIKLFDNGRFEAVGLYGSLTHPLRKVYTNGTWISKDGVTFLTLPNFKKKLPIKKVFYLPNPNFTIKRVYEQKH